MKKDSKEIVHLCPSCNVVEMEFLEKIETKKYDKRKRRFKCPVCGLTEMYTSGGPDDLRRQEKIRNIIQSEKYYRELKKEYNDYE